MTAPILTVVQKKPHKATHTKTDTLELTPEVIASWEPPPFQRGLRVNGKVLALVETIKEDGVIPGFLTLGIYLGKTYLLDGQHRVHAFTLTGMSAVYADVRILHCSSMKEMGDEFVELNSRLVNFKPDDILKGLEPGSQALQLVRRHCTFVGYDNIRRGPQPKFMVGMSQALRCWDQSVPDVPTGSGTSAQTLAEQLSVEDAEQLAVFLKLCLEAWGKDPEYHRLWGGLNLILCAWLYRRTVLSQYSPKSVRLTKDQFKKCLMSLSSEGNYLAWLVGKNVNERDRSPAYSRIKAIFTHRVELETGKRPLFPAPAWAHGGGTRPSHRPRGE